MNQMSYFFQVQGIRNVGFTATGDTKERESLVGSSVLFLRLCHVLLLLYQWKCSASGQHPDKKLWDTESLRKQQVNFIYIAHFKHSDILIAIQGKAKVMLNKTCKTYETPAAG